MLDVVHRLALLVVVCALAGCGSLSVAELPRAGRGARFAAAGGASPRGGSRRVVGQASSPRGPRSTASVTA